MRALAVETGGGRLVERALAEPRIERDDHVLFRIAEVGVCGTDRSLVAGEFGWGPAGESTLVIGHEASGEVLAVGPAVERLRPGDWVVPLVRRPCEPACESCARGRRDLCVSGRYLERGIFGLHGYYTELAVDRECDLAVVAADLREVAVLAEPLSVVEKAVATAVRLHEGTARRAVVYGAGAIGLLASLALRARGLAVTVVSLEDEGHPKVRWLEDAGVEYRRRGEGPYDLAIEACGAPAAAMAALGCLAPLGVLIVLGARNAAVEFPFIDLITGNRAVAGTVNAGPGAFTAAMEDLARFPRALVERLIDRRGFGEYRSTLLEPPGEAPKPVHVVGL